MRIEIGIFLLCLSFFGCNNVHQATFDDLLSDHFISMVDTLGYKTGKLIQIPHDSAQAVNLDRVCILVDTELNDPSALDQSVLTSLRAENQSEFEYLIDGKHELDTKEISLDHIRNTGRYMLVSSNSIKKAACGALAGKLTLFKPYLEGDRAILTISVSDGEKAGFTNCFLFFRKGNEWAVHKKYELERW